MQRALQQESISSRMDFATVQRHCSSVAALQDLESRLEAGQSGCRKRRGQLSRGRAGSVKMSLFNYMGHSVLSLFAAAIFGNCYMRYDMVSCTKSAVF